ncbi:MAG: HAMP domain-containing sensor histidine kinase [Phycisphaerae bacterium]
MTWASRSTRFALWAYALLAALILGGAAWGTVITIEQIKTRRDVIQILKKNDFRASMHLVVGRIEDRLTPVIGREAARDYWEYDPYTHPQIHRLDGTKVISDGYLQPSPLIRQRLEPWIKLHFQVDSHNDWQSPQIPTDYRFASHATIAVVDGDLGAERLATLEHLSEIITFETLAAKIDAYKDSAIGGHSEVDYPARCRCISVLCVCEKRFGREYDRRARNQQQLQSTSLPEQACEHPAVALSNLRNLTDYDADDETLIPIEVSKMTAVWIKDASQDDDQLIFVRSMTPGIEGLKFYQGFVVDWALLKKDLLGQLEGVDGEQMPEKIDIVPVTSAESSDSEYRISALPAAVVAHMPQEPEPPWTTTYLQLGVGWIAVLAILGGVGLGIQSLLSLAERRTQFAYAVTHELRTPLTTLRLYADMLAGGLVRPEDHDRYVNTLNIEAERLSDLVDEVLEYARVENHKVRLDLRSVTVSEILDSIREHCAGRCGSAGKKLVVESNGLASTTVRTDPQLVRQVVTNLIDNACKYAREAQDPTITLRAVPQTGGKISFDIEDHGPGIPPNQRHNIFKPFRRASGDESHRPGGIGLGLVLARNWARLLHGRLELMTHNSPGRGACFRLTIPCRV